MSYDTCIRSLAQAAGRELTDKEVIDIYERVHKAALDIKAGRASAADVAAGKKVEAIAPGMADDLVRAAAERAAQDLIHEAQVKERQALLQISAVGSRAADAKTLRDSGLAPLDAVEKLIVRDYSGKLNLESLEQRVTAYQGLLGSKLGPTWEALGKDFLGFFQDQTKLLDLVRELRGEDTGNALAKKGAQAFHQAAEYARVLFNRAGGDIGKLDDWGMPQHHSQERVANAGGFGKEPDKARQAWVDAILPKLDRTRYVDDVGRAWSDAEVRDFLGKAWLTIATDGHSNIEPGQFTGSGKRANRHGEHRQIHFKDAQSVIEYWREFGDRTAVEILNGHIESMAKDIAFVEHFGPNPNLTFATLLDTALKDATEAMPAKSEDLAGQAVKLENLYNYSAGRTKASANLRLSQTADGIAQLNTAGKLGGASLASLFGDKPMMEAVAHLNNQPMVQRWMTELSLLNPMNAADRRLLRQQGLMLEGVRSGLNRFYEGLGKTGWTGKLANAVMRVTGMTAINDIRKGSFGLSLMNAIGEEIRSGRDFSTLGESDVRALTTWGITEADWRVWQLAKLDNIGHGNDAALTPEAIGRISDADLKAAGMTAEDRHNAIVKLLGAVNTESEFAIVTPGWKERATFYGDLQRGTVKGELMRSVFQFKSFPWALFQRSMDMVANADTNVGKASMAAYLIVSTTLAGAMLMQVREMLSGKDPRKMMDDNWMQFWGAAFIQGGALGIYGDFLFTANQGRYGQGWMETMSGPTIGPLYELAIGNPANAIRAEMEGKDYHFWAKQARVLKGFIPGSNIWYAKAALDHLIWQNVMEALSPGYLGNMRQRTMREFNQDWWWQPGELSPDRGPDVERAFQ